MVKNKAIIYAIANQKGGVGKTTLTVNLGISLARMGKRVCLIDCDPQANLTMVLGYPQPDKIPVTLPNLIYELVNENLKVENSELLPKRDYILRGLDMDFIPSNKNLTATENMLVGVIGRESILKKIITYIKDDYDYILIDTMPSLNLITINALNAADKVIVPVQPQYLSAKGLELLFSTIENIKDNLNTKLIIDGVLITMYDNRLTLHKEMADVITETFKNLKIFNTKIPMSVRIAETQAKSVSIFDYAQSGKISEIYEQFTKELISGETTK
jgi:chromosome partitioning protein